MISTTVKCKCLSKKESKNWNDKMPRAWAIELQVPYDQNSIYWQMSGGTNLTLNTANKDAADMFEIDKDYDLMITPSSSES